MKWYNKLIAGVCTLAAVTLLADHFVQRKVSSSIQPYVQSHLEKIMKKQEKILGIKHFGIPEISLEILPSVRDKRFSRSEAVAQYVPNEDKIYINPDLVITPENFEKNPINFLAKISNYFTGKRIDVRKPLHYELGYRYANKLKNLEEDCSGLKLRTEVIAEYFRKTMAKKEGYTYSGDDSYFNIGPIIEAYGTKNGIEYLLKNPIPRGRGGLLQTKEYIETGMKKLAMN